MNKCEIKNCKNPGEIKNWIPGVILVSCLEHADEFMASDIERAGYWVRLINEEEDDRRKYGK